MLEEVESSRGSTTNADGNVVATILKTLDANKYATKKTIAQGLLDVALLTANASQLKYILQVGEKHEFYTLMLTLIIISIVLQILQGILCIFLGTGVDINEEKDAKQATKANNIMLCLNVLSVGINVLISAFEMKEDYGSYATSEPSSITTPLLPVG
ncbi:PREDICTED: ninjurin-2-like isoform X1 [Nicrophorus vespilloides]|uniref:Ninjurin-2-like isoform X1 n=1 Tax=Nicrophorus vespilloides TaxID=110193 RepID=A0ABM1MYI5_NICVS|nr:PREDICTED: ninjurin-2-like isoform X1 [Nicrophorus vespilloides]